MVDNNAEISYEDEEEEEEEEQATEEEVVEEHEEEKEGKKENKGRILRTNLSPIPTPFTTPNNSNSS